jgi:hypothetical protein
MEQLVGNCEHYNRVAGENNTIDQYVELWQRIANCTIEVIPSAQVTVEGTETTIAQVAEGDVVMKTKRNWFAGLKGKFVDTILKLEGVLEREAQAAEEKLAKVIEATETALKDESVVEIIERVWNANIEAMAAELEIDVPKLVIDDSEQAFYAMAGMTWEFDRPMGEPGSICTKLESDGTVVIFGTYLNTMALVEQKYIIEEITLALIAHECKHIDQLVNYNEARLEEANDEEYRGALGDVYLSRPSEQDANEYASSKVSKPAQQLYLLMQRPRSESTAIEATICTWKLVVRHRLALKGLRRSMNRKYLVAKLWVLKKLLVVMSKKNSEQVLAEGAC